MASYRPQGLFYLICYALYNVMLSTEILQINGRGWLKCEHKTCHINYQETLPVISILLLEEKYHLNTFLLIQLCSLQMIKLYNH